MTGKSTILLIAVFLFGIILGILANTMSTNATTIVSSPTTSTTTTTTSTTTVSTLLFTKNLNITPGFNVSGFVDMFELVHYSILSAIGIGLLNPLTLLNPASMHILYNYAPQLFPAGTSNSINLTILEIPPSAGTPGIIYPTNYAVSGLTYNSTAFLSGTNNYASNIMNGINIAFTAVSSAYTSRYVAIGVIIPPLAVYNNIPGLTIKPLSGEFLLKMTPTFSGVSSATLYMATINKSNLINPINITALKNNTTFTDTIPLNNQNPYGYVLFVYIITNPNQSVTFKTSFASLILFNVEVTAVNSSYSIGFLNFNDTLNAPAPAGDTISAMNNFSPYIEQPWAMFTKIYNGGVKILSATTGSTTSSGSTSMPGILIKFPPAPFITPLTGLSSMIIPLSAYVSYMPLFKLNTSLISAFNVVTPYPAIYTGGVLNLTSYINTLMNELQSTGVVGFQYMPLPLLIPSILTYNSSALYPFLYMNYSNALFLQNLIPIYFNNMLTFSMGVFTRYPPIQPQFVNVNGFKFIVSPSMLKDIYSTQTPIYKIKLAPVYPFRNVTITLNNVVNGNTICIPLPPGVTRFNATIIGNATATLYPVGTINGESCYSISINGTTANLTMSLTYFLSTKLHLLDKLNHPLPFATPLILGNGVKAVGNASLPPGTYTVSIPAHPKGFQLVLNGQPVPTGINAVNLTLTLNTTGTELNLTYRVPVSISLTIVETPTGFINVVGHIRNYYGAPVVNAPVIVELYNSSNNALLFNATVTTDGNGNFHANSNIKVSDLGVGTLSSSSPVYAEAVYPGSSDYTNNQTTTNQLTTTSTTTTTISYTDLLYLIIALVIIGVIMAVVHKSMKHAVLGTSRFNKRR
jgi:hypothetical protein